MISKKYILEDYPNEEFVKNVLPLLKKFKVTEKNIMTIAQTIGKVYNRGYSVGYHESEIDAEESMASNY